MTPTVVLLHGVGLDHRMWEPVTEILGDGYDVVTPDLLGHGDEAPAPEGTTLDDLVDAVLGRIPDGAHVVGFSLGALVAQRIALRFPDRVASLTSVASVCRRTESERASVLARYEVAKSDYRASIDASVARWYDGSDLPRKWVDWTRETLEGNDVDSFLNCYRVFATGDAEVGPHLGDIAVPALAVTGAADPGSTPEMTSRLEAAVPGCRAVIVDGARHMLPVERPTELATVIVEFIGGLIHV
ncbi:alpha/beta fold hydrolase [Rhodococcoides kyotonense]|uniref:Pimeloyl-ACP methyl ester carboxylesterase n=1 Tax=Rhodococcoides kyotonense TaxID=398843 RepID=A0A239LID9_9NOCA|nr:alpha/beta fold hydrolase [Rhodococcus kyotonensis]SNT29603.1 Pimeloyl-ACP methyl ester carboxylesterase [Rhodococcus kyotonensis]